MKKADLLDRKILKVISVDARRSFKEIAAQCGVSRAAIHQRVVRMVQRGIIVGSGYQVNPKFLHLKDLLNNRIQEIPGVTSTETMISLEQSISRTIPIGIGDEDEDTLVVDEKDTDMVDEVED